LPLFIVNHLIDNLQLKNYNSGLKSFKIMLQDTQTIRYYQQLTDALVYMWNRGYRFDDLRLYIDGYLAALRHSNALEAYLIHRLEEEATRYLRDPSNFVEVMPLPETESDYY
jgi:hypothetical protein